MLWRILAAVALLLSAPIAAQPAPQPPSAERIRHAEEALARVDDTRMLRDAEYAGTITDHLLVLQAAPGHSQKRRAWLDRIVVYGLAAAGRHDPAETAADTLLRAQPEDRASYEFALFAAQRARRWPRVADLVERTIRDLPAEGWQAVLPPSSVGMLVRDMRAARDRAALGRVAGALLAAGWPSAGSESAASDWLREIVIERDLDRGDVAAARRRYAEVRDLGSVLRFATDRRYDPLLDGADRDAAIRAAIERGDRSTAERLAGGPEDTERLVSRAAFLRSIGRDRDVLDLLLPLMAEVRIVAGRHTQGLWLVNEAAYSLIATGAAGEAAELMRPLFTMDLAANPELVNTSINFVGILWQAGRSGEALQRAEEFMAASAGHASDYGRMWIAANAVCAAADLRRSADSDAWLARTAGIAESNPSAMLQALLCRNDLEAAEQVILTALGGEQHRSNAILWLQDYEPQPQAAATERLREAFRRLRARPAVEAAFAQAGHRLRLPIPAVLYGWY